MAQVVGLLNSGQSFDAQQEPAVVPLPPPDAAEPAEAADAPRDLGGEVRSAAVRLACSEMGSASLHADGKFYLWGMQRYFLPTTMPGGDALADAAVADVQMGATHVAILTDGGRLYTFGQGTALAVPKVEPAPARPPAPRARARAERP